MLLLVMIDMQNVLQGLAYNRYWFAHRTMELQMTDFENAAFSVFVVLLTRAIVSFNLNMYIPISKVCDPNNRVIQASLSRRFVNGNHVYIIPRLQAAPKSKY